MDRRVMDHLREHLERRLYPKPLLDFEKLQRDQWDDQFIAEVLEYPISIRLRSGWVVVQESYAEEVAAFLRYMKNRMVLGAYRYGPIRDKRTVEYDNIGSLIQRVRKYRVDGNLEHLVDVANLALVEYVRGSCVPQVLCDGVPSCPLPPSVLPGYCTLQITEHAWRYKTRGDREALCTVAALAMAEFVHPTSTIHPRPHFTSVDDGIHAERL